MHILEFPLALSAVDAMSGKVHIEVDTRQVDKELNRLSDAPGMKTLIAFNALFAEITAEVMALIHVETGSLKTTARWDTDPFPTGWQGTVHVGGAAPGEINDPAYYGVFELARGGSHFFFAPAYAQIPSKMVDIILDFYAGGDAGMAEQATTPSTGGGLGAAVKSVEGSVKNTAKKVKKKVEKRVEEDLHKDEETSSLSGRSGEGLKRASRKKTTAGEEKLSKETKAAWEEFMSASRISRHRSMKSRRR